LLRKSPRRRVSEESEKEAKPTMERGEDSEGIAVDT
jgi:hypothetical protein